jgi:predicted nucleotide-binding protein
MEYYHVLMLTGSDSERVTDLSIDELKNKIVEPYRLGDVIFVNGTSINSLELGRIHIRKTNEQYEAISDRLYQKEKFSRSRYADIVDLTPYNNYENAFWEGEDVLDQFIEGPAGYAIKNKKASNTGELKDLETERSKVFIVHGHNEEMKQSVARLLEKLGLTSIILHEQASKGKTIIEKFSEYSDVSFAIVLLSADDRAYQKKDNPDNAKYRARQNVILELGYFLGKLGRENVTALFEDNEKIEIPSDYSGVIYIPYNTNEGWKLALAKELKASGFEIDLNQLF